MSSAAGSLAFAKTGESASGVPGVSVLMGTGSLQACPRRETPAARIPRPNLDMGSRKSKIGASFTDQDSHSSAAPLGPLLPIGRWRNAEPHVFGARQCQAGRSHGPNACGIPPLGRKGGRTRSALARGLSDISPTEQLAGMPDASCPKAAGSEGVLEGTYRFLNHDDVTPERILAPQANRRGFRTFTRAGGKGASGGRAAALGARAAR